MATLIKHVRNKNVIEFDNGSFDQWCVYLTRFEKPRYAPKDTEYFHELKQFGNYYGHAKIYNDFVKYYLLTNKNIDPFILDLITVIADGYELHSEEMDTWFSVIYAGMVAEENKEKAILKKRIKRLGMHQLLLEGFPPEYAANFSKGKKWQELDLIMKQRGF